MSFHTLNINFIVTVIQIENHYLVVIINADQRFLTSGASSQNVTSSILLSLVQCKIFQSNIMIIITQTFNPQGE